MKHFGWLLLAVLLMAGVIGYLMGESTPRVTTKVSLPSTVKNCNPVLDLCTASDHSHSVVFRLDPSTRYLKPFEIEVTIKGFNVTAVKTVSVDFNMVDMDMGINRFSLNQVIQQETGIVYRGRGILPVCVTGRRDWQAVVEVDAGDTAYQAVFNFIISKR
jgi:hypothetical protein